MKSCRTCEYYLDDSQSCGHPSPASDVFISRVTRDKKGRFKSKGNLTLGNALIMRLNDQLCGKDGAWYKQRKQSEQQKFGWQYWLVYLIAWGCVGFFFGLLGRIILLHGFGI